MEHRSPPLPKHVLPKLTLECDRQNGIRTLHQYHHPVPCSAIQFEYGAESHFEYMEHAKVWGKDADMLLQMSGYQRVNFPGFTGQRTRDFFDDNGVYHP